jgi:hypothetical protein
LFGEAEMIPTHPEKQSEVKEYLKAMHSQKTRD